MWGSMLGDITEMKLLGIRIGKSLRIKAPVFNECFCLSGLSFSPVMMELCPGQVQMFNSSLLLRHSLRLPLHHGCSLYSSFIKGLGVVRTRIHVNQVGEVPQLQRKSTAIQLLVEDFTVFAITVQH